MSQDLKSTLRQAVLKQRDALLPAVRAEKSQDICARLQSLECYRDAQGLLGYWPIKSELDITAIMKAHLARGRTLVLPRINNAHHRLDLYRVTDLENQTHSGVWGIREPNPATCSVATPAEIDLVLIPGAAFDQQGNRLGYGAGFYDRLLATPGFHATVVACLFEEQFTTSIPVEPHDVPVDILVSDLGVIHRV
jgi:5-formyltetrahydrofolate cyclo-ligase